VASLETLLGVAAVDKLDPQHRVTPPDRELMAQGVGNVVSGVFGGLPMTSVIVRSSANVNAGARSRWSAIFHGLLLLVSAVFLARHLNRIPLAALAAVLIATGYKLTHWKVHKEMYARGWDQFVPFVVTIASVLLTDLLIGIGIGIATGVYFHIRSNFRSTMVLVHDDNNYLLRLRKDVSFFAKPLLREKLAEVPKGARLLIDISKVDTVDQDILDVLQEYVERARLDGIHLELRRNDARTTHRRLRLDIPLATEPAPPEVQP
jgi:MFS superfamily sulfate permease-like transporter